MRLVNFMCNVTEHVSTYYLLTEEIADIAV